MHPFQSGEPYYLGMFLSGAYQEIMGNLHNLFGDTNVHIQLTPKGYQIEHVVKGDTMSEVVGYVQYDAEDLVECIRRRSEQAPARKAHHACRISATAANEQSLSR